MGRTKTHRKYMRSKRGSHPRMTRRVGGFSSATINKATEEYFKANYDKSKGTSEFIIQDVVTNYEPNDPATITNVLSQTKNKLSDLPALMAIYKALMLEENIGDTKKSITEANNIKVPNKTILKFVVMKINEIGRKYPHPGLPETILYYFDVIGFDTLYNMMGPYLDQVVENLVEKPKMSHDPDAITTYLEKSLTQHESMNARDADPVENRKLYNVITHVPNTNNTYAYGTHIFNLLANHPWGNPNLIMSKHVYVPKLYNGTFGNTSSPAVMNSALAASVKPIGTGQILRSMSAHI